MISPNAQALLNTIRFAEGTDGPDGYRTMFTGKLFNDLSRHPRQLNRSGRYTSDAAGGYQFLSTTWDGAAKRLGLTDFSPASQDRAALELIRRRGVDPDAPLTREALARLAPEWASLPTLKGRSYYGQPVKSHDQLFNRYNSALAGSQQGASAAGASGSTLGGASNNIVPTGGAPRAVVPRTLEELVAGKILGTSFAEEAGLTTRMAGSPRVMEAMSQAVFGMTPGEVNAVLQPLSASQPTPTAARGRLGGASTNWKRDPDAEQSGYDISKPGGVGAPIVAPVDLRITGKGFQGQGSGETGRGYGNWLSGEFRGSDNRRYELLLGHLNDYAVKPGSMVPAGTILGTQGISGRAFGPHVTTHVNALDGGNPWSELDRITKRWTAPL